MTFLSRIHINPLRGQSRRLLGNPQAMHATVLGGLPSQPVDERVLWRLDPVNPHRPSLFVLTETEPAWDHLVEQAGWPGARSTDDSQVVVRPYETLLDRLRAGDHYRFRLTANPVSATRRDDRLTTTQRESLKGNPGRRSPLVPHRTPDHQLVWLLDRQERLGITIPPARASEAVGEMVPDAAVVAHQRLRFRKKGASDPVSLQTATFEGNLVVTDPLKLRDAMLEGVGRAKAYGCGLLTLAPAARVDE